MHKCGIWKPENDNQTMPNGETSEKIVSPSYIKTLLGRDYEVENAMRLFKISMILAVSYSHK